MPAAFVEAVRLIGRYLNWRTAVDHNPLVRFARTQPVTGDAITGFRPVYA